MDLSLLPARLEDALTLADQTGRVKTVGFLTGGEGTLAQDLATAGPGRFELYGGYEHAERRLFVALPEWCKSAAETGVITAVTFGIPLGYSVAHKDVLGTLMALGITRECVGDILVADDRAVVFLSSDIAPFVVSQVRKIGGVGVTAQIGYTEPLPGLSKLVEKSATVASVRLDSVVAALWGTSREKAKTAIEDGLVTVEGIGCLKITKEVRAGQWIGVRKVGRFRVDDCSSVSKKGRIVLRYSTYES